MTLVLHAEHGGGNNSSFTTHVVSSTGTDTYSSIAASLGSLKGPRHGGANLKVVEMFDDLRANVTDWEDDEQIADYLHRLLDKEAFDRRGLVYGMGHPVYSVSDPRAVILRGYAERARGGEGLRRGVRAAHERVERIAPLIISAQRRRLQGRQRQRRLLLRLRLPDARHPGRAVHAAVRDLARRRLERAPARGARQRRQAHPARLQERRRRRRPTCRSRSGSPSRIRGEGRGDARADVTPSPGHGTARRLDSSGPDRPQATRQPGTSPAAAACRRSSPAPSPRRAGGPRPGSSRPLRTRRPS